MTVRVLMAQVTMRRMEGSIQVRVLVRVREARDGVSS